MVTEPNNIIADASNSGINSTGKRSVVLSGDIASVSDVDIYQFQIPEGDGIILDIDAHEFGSSLDSILRLFDAQGNELAVNDDNESTNAQNLDSYLTYIPEVAGNYYIGVSGYSNFNYNPLSSSDENISDGNNGTYDLKLELVEIVGDDDTDNTIAEASETGLSSTGERNKILNGAIDPASDVDIFKLQLNAGDGVTIDVDTNEDGSGLDSYLRLLDADGNQLAVNDNTPAAGEDLSSDPYLGFVPQTSGDYFIAVSSSGNFAYDPVAGNNNFSEDQGFSTGTYQLDINILEVIGDDDPDNTITEAIDTQIGSTTQKTAVINESIDVDGDTDLFKLELTAGDIVAFDIDAAVLDSELDSSLRLFNADGQEIAVNDDAEAPLEVRLNRVGADSYILYQANTTGDYYVGVSGYDNSSYDPVNGSNNFNTIDGLNYSIGNYKLNMTVFNEISGTDDADEVTGTPQPDLIDGKGGNDRLLGAGEADYLVGGSGDDFLSGSSGNDVIDGGNGSDVLWGGTDNDTLGGGNGVDSLYGNSGADTFVLGLGADVIFDFQDGTDKILLTNDLDFADLKIEPMTNGVGTSISTVSGAIATLQGIDADLITAADFVIQ
jgi:Ca2+-binding RTX toxin-like protein